ncbi:MAG TPA: hypothetical protein VGL93_09075 [Streptosporangiaceae bacterium]
MGRPAFRAYLPFLAVFALATAVRVVAMLAYQGILWFPDSNSYLAVAVAPQAYPVRPQGYAFFLRLLEPAHSFTLVAGVQHAMGLAVGAIIYVTLWLRFNVRNWISLLAVVPVYFDAYQIQLEHLLLSDVLFELLIVAAVALVLWRPDGNGHAAAAGLCLGLATLTRSVALPLLVVFAVYLLVRRRWWQVAITAVACALPILPYMLWFQASGGGLAMSNSEGLFLYGRTASFADCSVIRPTPAQRPLCPPGPPGERSAGPNYVWHFGYFARLPNDKKFTPAHNDQAEAFALAAIRAQPGDYLSTGLRDLRRTFTWNREPYPTEYSTRLYDFHYRPDPLDLKSEPVPDLTLGQAVRTYLASPTADGSPYVRPELAAFMVDYQRYAVLRGTMLLPILVGGAIMLVVRRQRAAGAFLPWLCALALLVTPPFTAAFGYRYVVPAVPLACLALALTFMRRRAVTERTDEPEPPPVSEGVVPGGVKGARGSI